jgi:cysteine desulfuration protein SufE
MPIEDKILAVKKDFPNAEDWEKKYEKIIEYGKKWPGLDEKFKTEDLKVKGCQSQVWIKAELTPDKKVIFRGDSDAIIVKGLVAIALSVYSGESPDTILKTEPIFLKEIGFDSGLSPSRSNGLYSMIKQIKYYATAFQYLLSK